MTPASPTVRSGFTLIELAVVMIIIAALSGIIIPVLLNTSSANDVRGAQALVDSIAAQIDDDKAVNGGLLISLKDGSLRYKWDFNRDDLLDGYPEQVFTTDADKADARNVNTQSGEYLGFYGTFGGNYADSQINITTGELQDPWGEVIRIQFHSSDYGPSGFGVYSLGPDQENNTDDDISSWGSR
jgi:prepilin-type N-terminal cleavage/methylation domain-containing protein